MSEMKREVIPPTNAMSASIGDNKIVKTAAGIGTAILAGAIANKFGNGKLVPTLIGGVVGFVGAYKLAPELITDVQRANEYDNAQQLAGKEVSFVDRLKHTLANFGNISGQTYTSATADYDPMD